MRGKNILWLSLIAMLLSVMMVNMGTTVPGATKLVVDPPRLPDAPNIGHPFDEYYISIKVENVEDLYGVGFTVKIAPWGRTLVASDILEGDFLSQGGHTTAFSKAVNMFAGTIKIGISRLGAVPGATGTEGTLATMKLTCVEGGNSPIDILDSYLLDSNLNPIDHNTKDGDFYGATADLVGVTSDTHIHVGEESYISVRAKNDADVPLCVRARFEMERQEDGRDIRLYCGQTYYGGFLGADPPTTWLYCDGYHEVYEWGWVHWGASPWLNATEDGNLVNSTAHGDMTSMYTFENITLPYLGIYNVISNIDFYGYTKCASEDPDVDPYAFTIDDEGNEIGWCWCDSMGGTTSWAWTGCRYYFGQYDFPEYYGFPQTETAVNNAELLLYNYHGDDGLQVDALRAKVEFATITPVEPPIVCIPPGKEMEIGKVTWVPVEDHIGKYDASVTLEYSELYDGLGYHFKNTGKKVHYFHFWVEE